MYCEIQTQSSLSPSYYIIAELARSEPLAEQNIVRIKLVHYVVYQEKVAIRVKCIYREANWKIVCVLSSGIGSLKRIEGF